MNKRKIGAIIFGIATLIAIGYTIYKGATGKDVGFNEIMTIATLLMMFLSAVTWGDPDEKENGLQKDELGRKIMEESSKISYFILMFIILIAVASDQFVNGTVNIFLLAVLGFAMITLPFVEFLVAKKYQ